MKMALLIFLIIVSFLFISCNETTVVTSESGKNGGLENAEKMAVEDDDGYQFEYYRCGWLTDSKPFVEKMNEINRAWIAKGYKTKVKFMVHSGGVVESCIIFYKKKVVVAPV